MQSGSDAFGLAPQQHASTSRSTPTVAAPLELSWSVPRGMVQLSLVNFALRVVTLGLYNFWGKTEARARLWSGIRINGEPLSYNGTGWELFIGFAVAMLYIVVPYGSLFGSQLYFGPTSPMTGVVTWVFLLVISWMWSIAFYRARRFRLTRTSWRGITGDLTGSPHAYAWTALWTTLIVSISLGWAYPWRQTKLQRMLVENTRIGDKQLTFTGSSDQLYGAFALMWFGNLVGYGLLVGLIASVAQAGGPKNQAQIAAAIAPAVLAGTVLWLLVYWLTSAWYQTRSFNHYMASTHADGVSFEGTATAGSLLGLNYMNAIIAIMPLLLIIGVAAGFMLIAGQPLATLVTAGSQGRFVGLIALLSLGLFGPYLQTRTAGFWLSNLQIRGTFATSDLQQGVRAAGTQGEGLAQAFDMDIF